MMMDLMQILKAFSSSESFSHAILGNSQVFTNPLAKNALEMLRKGDSAGIKNMAENLAREHGTTADNVRSEIMRRFGVK